MTRGVQVPPPTPLQHSRRPYALHTSLHRMHTTRRTETYATNTQA